MLMEKKLKPSIFKAAQITVSTYTLKLQQNRIGGRQTSFILRSSQENP